MSGIGKAQLSAYNPGVTALGPRKGRNTGLRWEGVGLGLLHPKMGSFTGRLALGSHVHPTCVADPGTPAHCLRGFAALLPLVLGGQVLLG